MTKEQTTGGEENAEFTAPEINPLEIAGLLGRLFEPKAPRGDTIDRLTKLGAKAKGIRAGHLHLPACIDDPGLPAVVPVAISSGDNPDVLSVKEHFEQYRDRPERKRGTANALTLQSFCNLTTRHATDDSVIFADTDWQKPSFTAIIDYHGKNAIMNAVTEDGETTDQEAIAVGLPEWMQHRIHYSFPLSEEWKTWVANNGKPMSQGDFAAFLEDRIGELTSPNTAEKNDLERDFATTVATPNQIIMLSRGLKVHVESKGGHIVNLATGEGQVSWEEVHKDAEGNALKVPGIFLINIAPFHRGDTVRVPVRLRYRVSEGKVVWFYQLYRPDLHITERVLEDLRITGEETGLPVYEGRPEH